MGVMAIKPAGTAFASISSSDDLEFRYTDVSGQEIMDVETTGFLDQATAQNRWAPVDDAGRNPVPGAPVVVRLPGAITTGDTDLKLRVYYRYRKVT